MIAGPEKSRPYGSDSDRHQDNRADAVCESYAEGTGQDMGNKRPASSKPARLDPCNDRKIPHTDAELDRLLDDQIAMMADTAA